MIKSFIIVQHIISREKKKKIDYKRCIIFNVIKVIQMLSASEILGIVIILIAMLIMIILCYTCCINHHKKIRDRNKLNYVKNMKKSNKITPYKLQNIYSIV
jgi:hypothetical protein